jgi:hypothetical protein
MNQFQISKLWDGTSLPESERVNLIISVQGEALVITVDAPFYNDPKPSAQSALNLDGLWNFEVVEVFIKGRHDKYIEIEMGPHGHYLVLVCDGYRQCFSRQLELTCYSANLDACRWSATMVCPISLLPPPTDIPGAEYSFNAYSIHNAPDHTGRVHAALFPPWKAEGEYEIPDFHKLELFNHFPSALFGDAVNQAGASLWDGRSGISVGAVEAPKEDGENSPCLRE